MPRQHEIPGLTSRILRTFRELDPVMRESTLTDAEDRKAIVRVRVLAAELGLSARGFLSS